MNALTNGKMSVQGSGLSAPERAAVATFLTGRAPAAATAGTLANRCTTPTPTLDPTRGPAWTTAGIEVDLPALEQVYARFSMPLHLPYTSWNDAVPIYADAEQRQHVGRATSGTWSPILKKYVAICRLRPAAAAPGARVFFEATVEGQRFAVPATVVKLPFFDPPRKRA